MTKIKAGTFGLKNTVKFTGVRKQNAIYLSASALTAEGKVLLLNWTYCDWSVFVCETEVRNLSTSQRSYCSSLQCNFWWTDCVTAGELITTAGELVTTAEAEQRSTKQAKGFKLLSFSPSFSLSSLLAERDWITVEKRVEKEGGMGAIT